ncbi:MAG: hypothetical protein QW356_05395 [Candidatus Hadarchaeales archaeon]
MATQVGFPDWQEGVVITGQTIDKIKTDIVAQTIAKLAVDIASQTLANLNVNISQQTLEKIAVDIVAQSIPLMKIDLASATIGKLAVDVAAQTLATLGIDIRSQTLEKLNMNIYAQTLGQVNIWRLMGLHRYASASFTLGPGESATVLLAAGKGCFIRYLTLVNAGSYSHTLMTHVLLDDQYLDPPMWPARLNYLGFTNSSSFYQLLKFSYDGTCVYQCVPINPPTFNSKLYVFVQSGAPAGEPAVSGECYVQYSTI